MKKAALILGLGAPLSWLLVPLMTIPASRGTDGGWTGMHAMFQAIAVVLIIHVICLLGLVAVLVLRIQRKQNLGKGLALAMFYFVVSLGIWIIGSGPHECWRDASALISGLFRKP